MVLGIGNGKAAVIRGLLVAAALVAGVRAGHVVCDGAQVAGLGQVEGALFVGDYILAQRIQL